MFKIEKRTSYGEQKCDNCKKSSKQYSHIICDDTDIIKLCSVCIKQLKKRL